MRFKFRLRDVLLLLVIVAVVFAILARWQSRGNARMRLANHLSEHGIFVVDESQFDGMKTYKNVQPINIDITVPQFKEKPSSLIADVFGEGMVAELRTIVLHRSDFSFDETVFYLDLFGKLERIIVLPTARMDAELLEMLRKRYPEADVIPIAAAPYAPEIGLDPREKG